MAKIDKPVLLRARGAYSGGVYEKVCIDILPWFLPLTPLTLGEDMKDCPDAYLGRIVLAILHLEGSH